MILAVILAVALQVESSYGKQLNIESFILKSVIGKLS